MQSQVTPSVFVYETRTVLGVIGFLKHLDRNNGRIVSIKTIGENSYRIEYSCLKEIA